jgi:hypothetical protein
MASNPKFSNAAVNAEADALAALFNGGKLRIYDGAQPATADTALGAQVKLAELTFANPAFAAAAAGLLTANAITTDVDAAATGTASWFRAVKSDGVTVIMDGSVGLAASDLILDAVAIAQHADVACTSFMLQVSKG